MLKESSESPRKVTRDHASLAIGQKCSTVLYSTPQPLAYDMKTHDFWQLDIEIYWGVSIGFHWCHCLEKAEFGVPGFPFFRRPCLHPRNFPARHARATADEASRGCKLVDQPSCGEPRNGCKIDDSLLDLLDNLDVQLPLFTRGSLYQLWHSCGSCPSNHLSDVINVFN